MTEYVDALIACGARREGEHGNATPFTSGVCPNEYILLFKSKTKELDIKDGGATEVAKVKAPFEFEDGMRILST